MSAEFEPVEREAELEPGEVVRVLSLLQNSCHYVLEMVGCPKGLETKKGQDQTGVWK